MTNKVNKLLINSKNTFFSVNLRDFSSEDSCLNYIAEKLNNGGDIIEIRTENIDTRNLINTGKKLRELTGVFEALLVIYDRIDIAQVINADGITLDKNSMSIAETNNLCENKKIIGCYTNVQQTDGADFLITENLKILK